MVLGRPPKKSFSSCPAEPHRGPCPGPQPAAREELAYPPQADDRANTSPRRGTPALEAAPDMPGGAGGRPPASLSGELQTPGICPVCSNPPACKAGGLHRLSQMRQPRLKAGARFAQGSGDCGLGAGAPPPRGRSARRGSFLRGSSSHCPAGAASVPPGGGWVPTSTAAWAPPAAATTLGCPALAGLRRAPRSGPGGSRAAAGSAWVSGRRAS